MRIKEDYDAVGLAKLADRLLVAYKKQAMVLCLSLILSLPHLDPFSSYNLTFEQLALKQKLLTPDSNPCHYH